MAFSLVWGVGLKKFIWRSVLVLALIPTYGFAVSNQDLMDRLDDIQIQRMIE
jgi:hypothetical protein